MTRKCPGCGSIFQSVNPLENGYIKKDVIANAKYCERCFKIMHYGKTLVVDVPKDIDSIINIVNKGTKHAIFLVDLLNINNSSIDIYNKITGPKTLVISKYDMFKSVIKESKVRELLRQYYKVKENILFISSIQNNTKELITYLEKSEIHKSYILGFINAGKSTLINKILAETNSEIQNLTTSYIPHTTMDFIKIIINENLTLIDSPGFSSYSHITEDIDLLKKINAKNKLKPITYQMKDNDTLLVEDMMSFKTSIKNSFTLYINKNLSHKKVYKEVLDYQEVELNVPDNSDIVIKGIGFINVKKESLVKVKIVDENLIEIRPSLFGGTYE